MKNAEMRVLCFDAGDVIATSGPVTYTISGVGDGDYKTFGFVSSDGIYNYKSAIALRDSKADILKKQFTNKSLLTIIGSQRDAEDSVDGTIDSRYSSYNGTYVWNETSGKYEIKQ